MDGDGYRGKDTRPHTMVSTDMVKEGHGEYRQCGGVAWGALT